MGLTSIANDSKKINDDFDPDDIVVLPKSRRRPKRIIEDDSSSSSEDDQDDIPLNKRKPVKKDTPPKEMPLSPQKKLKMDNKEQYDSPRSIFNLSSQRARVKPMSRINLHNKPIATTATPSAESMIRRNEPRVVIRKMSTRISDKKNVDRKAPLPTKPEFNAPLPVKSTPPSSNEFKAPFSVQTSSEFKAPAPVGPPVSNGFKAPMGPPSANGFKAPMSTNSSNGFVTPQVQQTDCKYSSIKSTFLKY